MPRLAFGAQRKMSPATKARNVAASILSNGLSLNDHSVWTLYGLQDRPTQQAAVREAHRQLVAQAVAVSSAG